MGKVTKTKPTQAVPVTNNIQDVDNTLQRIQEAFERQALQQGRDIEDMLYARDNRIQALNNMVLELARHLYEENPNASITFDVRDFVIALDA